MIGWDELDRELDAWQALGRTATFWWRDDDARQATPSLGRLLALSHELDVPIALAVVPVGADASLVRRLAGRPQVVVLQHGYAHHNHARPEEKKCEFGPHRPVPQMLDELAAGWNRLSALFPEQALPVVVPPWNRIDDDLVPALPEIGSRGFSTSGPRPSMKPVPGLRQVNVHVDIIDWSRARCFVGLQDALRQTLRHLVARRTGTVDASEPTGLLTHHLYHDGACWEFSAEFLRRSRTHPAVRWLDAVTLFAPAPG